MRTAVSDLSEFGTTFLFNTEKIVPLYSSMHHVCSSRQHGTTGSTSSGTTVNTKQRLFETFERFLSDFNR